ncbi:MAG TPA: 50S ribosome-binding GTPase [candidate division Zixibacteria bacterium]|nr:50S ribosome-binding GTPase [candidate division Zixibacteria bacterium]MDD4916402.1 50S ribosome-binding GTPase [candidate division Zixibacteria bacterium]MDM7974222.1 50S ribosome-binding GTPase [candidate division Zixibacteria bacterium]HOD65673.1 50S ribosome-binding GTPase [candidate division Zixibacteria bacterium]HPI33772.1 50S ribosome-binding GTPase [candidate division Zixibacteria bacterium]
MPANLPPQYYELERAYNAEKDPREKLRLAQELLRIMPKHKGTDKLQAEMKAKISRHRKEIEAGGARAGGAAKAVAKDYIEKEGAGQVILIGPPNAGKSSLLDALTSAKPEIGDYPYTTREPQPGMMTFETVQIQLIDTPPISVELYENYLTGLIRNADLVVLVCDLEARSMLDDLRFIIATLREKRIILQPEVAGEPDDPKYCGKRTVLCAHKEYEDEDGSKRRQLAGAYPGYRIVTTSIIDEASLEAFRRAIFEELRIIRVYTKPVGHDPDYRDPIILPAGGTVAEAAATLHKDFLQKLKFAKVWGKGKFDGQRVQNDYALSDGDIVEFHI